MSNFLAYTVVGLCTAGIFAIAASGLVLTYTTTGVFNFGHGAISMVQGRVAAVGTPKDVASELSSAYLGG